MEKRSKDADRRVRIVCIFSRARRICSAWTGEGPSPYGDSSDFSTSSIRSNALSNTLATVAKRRAWSSSRAIALLLRRGGFTPPLAIPLGAGSPLPSLHPLYLTLQTLQPRACCLDC